jgi:hypothetical protein
MDDDEDDAENPAPTTPANAEGDVSGSVQDAMSTPTPMPASPLETAESAHVSPASEQ